MTSRACLAFPPPWCPPPPSPSVTPVSGPAPHPCSSRRQAHRALHAVRRAHQQHEVPWGREVFPDRTGLCRTKPQGGCPGVLCPWHSQQGWTVGLDFLLTRPQAPWTAAHQAFLSFTISRNVLKFMSFESVMPTISSSVIPFSSCLQSFPASGSFPMSQFFASGGQSIGVSASASVFQ